MWFQLQRRIIGMPLGTIWSCQAGKDVYVEKPCLLQHFGRPENGGGSAKIWADRSGGHTSRSEAIIQSAMDFLHAGKLGKLYMVKCVVFRPRESLGRKPNGPIPSESTTIFGAGPRRGVPFNENRFHYNWHWFWETGNGETGNNGPHYTDMARWALQKYEHPKKIHSVGGYDVFDSRPGNAQHTVVHPGIRRWHEGPD